MPRCKRTHQCGLFLNEPPVFTFYAASIAILVSAPPLYSLRSGPLTGTSISTLAKSPDRSPESYRAIVRPKLARLTLVSALESTSQASRRGHRSFRSYADDLQIRNFEPHTCLSEDYSYSSELLLIPSRAWLATSRPNGAPSLGPPALNPWYPF